MRVILGLGANLGEPARAFRTALEGLSELARVLRVSALYRSAPVGPPQPEYRNAAVLLDSPLPLLDLLGRCQALERAAGRDRSREARWGPRPLDIDLLLADGIVVRGRRLVLPHPRLLERPFALVPAAEVAPEAVHPLAHRTLAALARGTAAGLSPLGPPGWHETG